MFNACRPSFQESAIMSHRSTIPSTPLARPRLTAGLGALAALALAILPATAQDIRERSTLRGTVGAVYSVAFLPDGKTLIAGAGTGTFDPKFDMGGRPPM